MHNLIEEYGYTDSGTFAAAISKLIGATIIRITSYGLPIHVCCLHQDKYIDAFGISTQEELIKRTCYEFPIEVVKFHKVDLKLTQNCSKFTEKQLEEAVKEAKFFLRKYGIEPEKMN